MLGFIQGLLLIIIEVSIYFFYAQTFCEAGDKITVRRTIATVVISAVLLDVTSTIFAKYFVIKLLMIVLVLSIMLHRIGERVLCLQQYIKVLFWLLIFVLLFWQVCFWKIGLFHYRRRRCYLIYCQKVSCFV